jgi:hypothetical protein
MMHRSLPRLQNSGSSWHNQLRCVQLYLQLQPAVMGVRSVT